MEFNEEIVCIDRNGMENKFKYSVEESHEYDDEDRQYNKWTFQIVPCDLVFEDWFEFSVTQISETLGKVTGMNNQNMKEYVGQGIPEKMIEIASTKLNIAISSSSNKPSCKSFPNEWRSIPASKVWDRLVKFNRAVYDEENDVYLFQK